jgi:regulator of ribonuclease activity A
MRMTFATCDLCDANEDKLADGSLVVLPPVYEKFGRSTHFSGPARTLKVFEDNLLVRAALETPGKGSVLIVDGGASLRCALVGGKLGVLAQQNGWAGIIVNGCVRDCAELNQCDVGIRALATHPRRSIRKGAGDKDLAVDMSGVMVQPGDWIYADDDGVLVSRQQLS